MISKPERFLVKANGGWCWFHSPRVASVEDWVLFSTVAGVDRDASHAGAIELNAFHPGSPQTQTVTLWSHRSPDDHNVAAVLPLRDGAVLTSYQGHSEGGNDGGLIRWRKVTNLAPLTITSENECHVGAPVSYSNLCQLRADGDRIYAFHRGLESNPNYLVSHDDGRSFYYGGRLLRWPRPTKKDPKFTGHDGARPYVVYGSNGADSIHFIASEDHPRAYDNSLYHGVFRDGAVHSSDGRKLETSSGSVSPVELTKVYAGSSKRIAWPIELRLDPAGRPIVLFSTRNNDRWTRRHPGVGGTDHRYMIGRFDGKRWNIRELCYAGSRLYAGEEDYTGLASLDPADSRVVIVSSNVDPVSRRGLRSATDGQQHWELFIGLADAAIDNICWRALTQNSDRDNIRPVVVSVGGDHSLVLWMQGHYRSYTDFDTDIVGAIYDWRGLTSEG